MGNVGANGDRSCSQKDFTAIAFIGLIGNVRGRGDLMTGRMAINYFLRSLKTLFKISQSPPLPVSKIPTDRVNRINWKLLGARNAPLPNNRRSRLSD